MDCNYFQYCSRCYSLWISLVVYSKDRIDFALLFTLKTTRKAGGLQILRCQGIAVAYYGFTLDAPALRDHTPDLISFGVRLDSDALRRLQRWGFICRTWPSRCNPLAVLPIFKVCVTVILELGAQSFTGAIYSKYAKKLFNCFEDKRCN